MSSLFSRFFPEKKFEEPDFSGLHADMHSHLLFGIDDGAENIEDSLLLIRELKAFGYKKLITTPHIMSDSYRNTPGIINGVLKEVREALVRENIDIVLEAAAEYYLDFDMIQKIKSEKLLSFGKNYVLFELSYLNAPENLKEAIFELQVAGYTPVLAHPERYPFWFGTFDEYKRIKDSGVLLQLNMNSLSGYYSPASKWVAEKLISENMVDFLGTDLHHTRHLEGLKRTGSLKIVHQLIDSGRLLNSSL